MVSEDTDEYDEDDEDVTVSRSDSYQSGEKDIGSTGHSIKNGVDELAWVYEVHIHG